MRTVSKNGDFGYRLTLRLLHEKWRRKGRNRDFSGLNIGNAGGFHETFCKKHGSFGAKVIEFWDKKHGVLGRKSRLSRAKTLLFRVRNDSLISHTPGYQQDKETRNPGDFPDRHKQNSKNAKETEEWFSRL